MDERFKFLGMNDEGKAINNDLRNKLTDVVKLIESTGASRHNSLALTKIEEAAMWFTKGLVRHPNYQV